MAFMKACSIISTLVLVLVSFCYIVIFIFNFQSNLDHVYHDKNSAIHYHSKMCNDPITIKLANVYDECHQREHIIAQRAYETAFLITIQDQILCKIIPCAYFSGEVYIVIIIAVILALILLFIVLKIVLYLGLSPKDIIPFQNPKTE